MVERLKEIQTKVLGWWNKFTTKQKSILVGIVAVSIFAFALLVFIFSRPQYVKLIESETTKETSQIIEILDGAGIKHRESSDGLTIEVEADKLSTANLALGAEGYQPAAYDDDLFNSGFSTTESDKQKQWQIYLEKKLSDDFSHYNGVAAAKVHLKLPDQDGTMLAKKEESSAYIRLELEDTFTAANAANLARAAATALGNASTANITIVDGNANLLFSGEEDYTTSEIANSMLELRSLAESMVAGQVKRVLLGTGQFDTAEVSPSLDINYSSYEENVKDYSTETGRDEGFIIHEDSETTKNQSSNGGIPGTDSNDGTTEQYQDNANSNSSSSASSIDRTLDERNTHMVTPAGGVNYNNSSVAVAAISYREVREEDVKAQGLLDGVTWEEYKRANGQDTRIDVDAELVTFISNATGISQDKISLVAYESFIFYDSPGLPINTTDVLSIVMMVVILALLAFVVLSTMRSRRQEQPESEELSVETLLQSMPEPELEDIALEEKSETRKLIEKFVDNNPETVANLLRNWLSDTAWS
ncbi:MAG: flagellar M-ring protein FliF [Clostridium sp.]|jgi:flagellar M-ring protein FliF|nr:flagellar M-ring protein FliF [Clostridium sp.]